MKKLLRIASCHLGMICMFYSATQAQITKLQTYRNNVSASIGTFQGINFREAGFSGLTAIPGTNGKEFWTVSDRGVNIDLAATSNPAACRNAYDKMYVFPTYAPKIHRVRVMGDSIQILQTISIKRPDGTGATGLLNPSGLGSTTAEFAQFDTLVTCTNFANKTTSKDVWGIDSEGIAVDKDGNFWLCEEGGPTVWKVDPNGKVLKRFTPYANLANPEPQDVLIDTVFKYRKNNRGFEGLTITPNGKVYAMIQSPILYPTLSAGENTAIHRLLEIDPTDNSSKVYAYLNDGPQGNIRFRDWKIGDLSAINDTTFLVIEAALRNGTDVRKIYKISITGASTVSSGLVYGGKSLEQLVDATTLGINGITPVKKTLFLDLLANGWPVELEKTEGLAIINDSTIAVGNDNDYGQVSPTANGIATPTTIVSHIITYGLKGANKLVNFVPSQTNKIEGVTGPSSSKAPYLQPIANGVEYKSILTAGDVVAGYKMVGIPDGAGAFDNGDGTFTYLLNHELNAGDGIVRAHGSKGALVSKWVIRKSDLSVVSGADLIQNVNLWNGTGYTTYNSLNPSTLAAFGRFCSAILPEPSAFLNTVSGLGTMERIFMNGEENGNEGRGFAHIVTGPNAGTSFELPYLGKFSWENAVPSPKPSDKTIVAGLDDSSPGQVYFYIGNKRSTGNEIEKAGLVGGNLYGVSVSGMFIEANTTAGVGNGFAFALANLGNASTMTGAQINTLSDNLGVTKFLRPEDGDWDPNAPNDFYFAATNSVNNPSRLWRLRFTDINNPELGGTATAVLDGTEGQQMLDNLTIDKYGHIILVEDVGGNNLVGKVHQYTISSDKLKTLGQHNPNLFTGGTTNPSFITNDEEASGPVDMENILGKGWFLVTDQIHNKLGSATEQVEGGQIVAMFNPDTYNANKGAYVGPSSSKAPYLLPLAPGVEFKSILTAGDVIGGYKMVGIPDGAGAFDNGNGTFTYLLNHELNTGDGIVRAHGSKGALVSKWVIRKSDLSVVSGADLIQNVNLWNGTGYTTYNSLNPSTLAAFGRFCSAILPEPSAFLNTVSGLGTMERIFMNGEENGNEGRGFAHIVTGPNAGTSFELPYLGKFSWENAVPSPKPSDKTIVAGLDDSSPGQVYFYIGNKRSTGNEIEKAGLVGGNLYGVSVSGMFIEANTTAGVGNGFAFALANLGNASTMTGAQINTLSDNLGVTKFLRPEDGDWDPNAPNDFYFAATNSVNNPSRLWRLRFTDINNPELGGTATAVLDGTEGQQMLDNLTIDKYGHIILVEDVGGNNLLGKVHQYTIATDQLKTLAQHNPTLFTGGTTNPSFITNDEEASGPVDMENILGKGWFLVSDQIHNKLGSATEQVEGGQIVAMFNPDTFTGTTPGGVITVVETSNAAATNVNIYPNPTESDVTVSLLLEKDDHVVINVADIQGKSVQNVVDADFAKGEQNIAVKTSNLRTGIYIVEVSTSKGTSRTKVVVIK